MSAPMYNVFVGSETGLLKGVDIGKNVWDNINSLDTVEREKEISAMCWADKSESKFYIGLKNKTVQTYDIDQGVFISETSLDAGKGSLIDIAKYDEGIITAVDSGMVRLWKNDELQLEFNAQENLHCMRKNKKIKCQLATGGKENDLKAWDLNNVKLPIFQAKNVKNDWLNLRVPVWITGIEFLQEEGRIVTCTGHHQIRVYDTKSQRRPVLDMNFDEYPLSAISLSPKNSNQVVVGNTKGSMALIDLRVGKMVHLFKGFAGGIRSIQCHNKLPLVASCGLDRFLRIHDINTKHLLHKYYLKSRLNCLLFATSALTDNEKDTEQNEDKIDEDVNDESDEEMWNKMEVVKTKTKRKDEDNQENNIIEIKKTKLEAKSHLTLKAKKNKRKK